MKLQYKISLTLLLFGIGILIPLSILYDKHNYQLLMEKEGENIDNIAKDIAVHIEANLKEKIAVALTLSTSELLKKALIESNAEFASLSELSRKKETASLNERWMNAKDAKDPFINAYLTNPASKHLLLQQKTVPDLYAEIFLTNRYGAMIAATEKLTTLAHAHKYWWKAGFDNGKGRIFLDDRGFDESAKAYVLGIVVPIKNSGEIIGILKCNINIKSAFTHINHHAKVQVVRTGGLVVSEQNVEPLTANVDKSLLKYLEQKRVVNEIISGRLVSIYPVNITLGSKKIGFGGSYKSIDHIMGNRGEAWHVVVSYDEKNIASSSAKTTRTLIYAGLIFLIIALVLALIVGKLITRPLANLSAVARKIGSGDLKTRAEVVSDDEIGLLSRSINEMAENLQNTMTSKMELSKERDRAQSYLDIVGVIVIILDINGNIRLFNKKACEITGYDVNEVLGRNWFEMFIPAEIDDEIRDLFNSVVTGEKPEYIPHINEIVTKSGTRRIISWLGISIRDEYDNRVGVLSSGADITEEYTVKEELKKKEEMMLMQSRHAAMGDMIAMIAHQWRQPITTIAMAANNILINIELEKEMTGSYLKKEMALVSKQTQHLSKTIDDFRNFFKPAQEKERVSLYAIYEDTMSIIGKSLENSNIEIKEQIDKTIEITTYKSELIQVLLNIFSNAKDAIKSKEPKTGVIAVAIKKRDAFIEIEICDNGGGIPEEDLNKIAEAYFSTKKMNGTGLGLYMSDMIVKKHLGGALSWKNGIIKSEKGVCFIIDLPAS